jgi:hypothetical protein
MQPLYSQSNFKMRKHHKYYLGKSSNSKICSFKNNLYLISYRYIGNTTQLNTFELYLSIWHKKNFAPFIFFEIQPIKNLLLDLHHLKVWLHKKHFIQSRISNTRDQQLHHFFQWFSFLTHTMDRGKTITLKEIVHV